MSPGPSLMIADAGAYRALGDGGEALWRRAAQLRAAIDTRLGKRHSDLFAIPHDHVSRIEWRAPFDGVVQRHADLSDVDRRALEAKVQELRPDLERLVGMLDAAGRSDGERAFGRLLRMALITPGPETLFAVDSRPVLAFWGFSAEGSAGTLLGLAATTPPAPSLPSWSASPPPPPPGTPTGWTAAPAAAPPPTPAPYGAPGPAGAGVPPGQVPPPGTAPYGTPPHGTVPFGAAPTATMAAVAPPAAAAWKWLLIAAFLLILLAVAAYFVKPHLPFWVWDGKYILPSAAGGPTGTTGGVDDTALRTEQAREATLRSDYERLWAQFSDKRNQCTPGQQGTGPGGTVVVPGTGAEDKSTPPGTVTPRPDDAAKPPAEARRPDGTPDPKAAPKPPATKPEAKPPGDTKTNPGADATRPTPPTTKPPADPRTAQKPGERPIEPVQIPKGPGVDFMKGDWRSNTDLTTQGGDEVIRPQYTFDKDGKGKTRIVQKNGVVCEGPAQASRDADGKLIIKETEVLKCTDGTTYAPSTVTCENGRDGRAQCQGSSEGGPTYAVQLGK